MRLPWPASVLWLLAGSFGAYAAIQADEFRSVPVSDYEVDVAGHKADSYFQLRSHSIAPVSDHCQESIHVLDEGKRAFEERTGADRMWDSHI